MYDIKFYDYMRSSKEAHRVWKIQNNGSDCCFIDIPVNIKSTARNFFGVGYQEEIIFVRDTSFWNATNQGLVLTDAGLYCIPDNENADSRFVFSWDQIKKVVYLDGCLYFHGYNGDDDVCPIQMSYFLKDVSDCEYIGRVLAGVLSGAVSLVKREDPFDVAINELNSKLEANDTLGAISYLEQLIAADDGSCKDFWYCKLGEVYLFRCKEHTKARSCFEEALKYCEEGSPISVFLHNNRRCIVAQSAMEEVKQNKGNLHNIKDVRRESLLVYQIATDEKCTTGVLMKDDALQDFKNINEIYCHNFCLQPYNDRKVLLVVNEYTNLYQDSVAVIKKSDLQTTGIKFPVGHPQNNQLYVGHPYLPTKYVPFEDYQLEFVEDRVREFCWLMQCMGATKISISANNDSGREANVSTKKNVSGSSSYSFTSVNASGNKNSEITLIEQISKAISLNQSFNPTKEPYVPNDLVWYQNEASWQRLCNQRMQGAFLQATEAIESRKSCMVNGSELSTIRGELITLFEISGEWTKEMEYKFQQQENATLSFDIKFAPLESLGANDSCAVHERFVNITSKEQEYLDELELCIEDGKIGARERRLLDKLRDKLGISLERANELENSLSNPALTDDEKEYYNEYKAACEDGRVSEKERRLLEKLRKMLGISEERAKEIESM